MTKVIKGAHTVPRVVVEAHARAAQIEAEAREAAAATVERLREESAASAREAARAELAAAHLEIQMARARELESISGSVLDLAVEVAERAVLSAFEMEPRRIRPLVEAALARVARARAARVHVHPADAPLLAGLRAEVVPSDEIERGDCVVVSEIGDVDARLEVRLEALRTALEAVKT